MFSAAPFLLIPVKNLQPQQNCELEIFALVVPKAPPGYAGGKKIAYSEE